MDYKWSIDLATLLRTNKGQKISISTKGNDPNATPYLEALLAHFSHTPINVKRGNKLYPLTFPLKFVPYDEKNIFIPQCVTNFSTLPFVHLFFISVASVDEYKTSVRHNISEWFAALSSKSDTQWLIVVDSTRAKEKKNRSQLLDKLKSDFSKHQQRLIEISESVEHGSFASLVQALRSALATHYEIIVDFWEKQLRQLKENRQENWDIFLYANEHMDFARFFWSLGCLEYALKLYDDLDALLYTTLSTLSPGHPPEWLAKLPRGTKSCPKISEAVHFNCVPDEFRSFLGLRHVLVSQQMLITLAIYQQRIRSATGAAPSIRVDFAGILLRYASHCIQVVVEHGTIHNILPDKYERAAWTIYFVNETLSLCDLLTSSGAVDGVSTAECHLYASRFNSFLTIGDLLRDENRVEREHFLEWFGKTDALLLGALPSEATLFTQIQKVYEVTANFLIQSGRHRTYVIIGQQYADYLRAHGHINESLSFEISYILQLIAGGSPAELVHTVAQRVLPKLDTDADQITILTILLYLALNGDSNGHYREQLDVFMQQNTDANLICLPSIQCPFKIRFGSVGMPVLMPGDTFSIQSSITSDFPYELVDCRVRIRMSPISQQILAKMTAPAFQLGYDKEDQKAIMTCVITDEDVKLAEPASKNDIYLASETSVALKPGANVISVSGNVAERGIYIFNGIDVMLGNASVRFPLPNDSIIGRDRIPMFLVQKTPNKLDVKMPSMLIAGITQTLTIILEAGARQEDVTEITISTRGTKRIVFLNKDKWGAQFVDTVPSMQKDDRHEFEIHLRCHLDGQTVSRDELFKEKIFLEWLGQVWPVELSFKPLFTLASSTTQLEANCLLETEMSRPADSLWTMVLEKASIEVTAHGSASNHGQEENLLDERNETVEASDAVKNSSKAHVAELLNPDLPLAPPSAVTSLVWLLGEGSDVAVQCRLRIVYSVNPSGDGAPNGDQYVYEDVMDVIAPRVEFELCAQMLSHHPGAQLCRAGTPCDLVINLRSLTNRIEALFVTLAADEGSWMLEERAKMVHVKESGVAQIVFTVVPCIAGFLPFPSVNVFAAQSSQQSTGDGFWSEEFTAGRSIITFQRTAGKQIRVLGGIGRPPVEKEARSALRTKLGKLFD